MLELRPLCEQCGADLPPDSDRARICTFECTFCDYCATWRLLGICPNCGGEFVTRPRRPAVKLAETPATTEVTSHIHDIYSHQATVLDRLAAGDLPSQEWIVSFANELSSDTTGYEEMGEKMDDLARQQPGFLSVDSVRDATGAGITVSRWSSIAALVAWRRIGSHAEAQHLGRAGWYRNYRSDVARVDRTATFSDR